MARIGHSRTTARMMLVTVEVTMVVNGLQVLQVLFVCV